MKEVTVNKEELLEKLRANRDKHRAVFLEARKGYRNAVIRELDCMLQEARDGQKCRLEKRMTPRVIRKGTPTNTARWRP